VILTPHVPNAIILLQTYFERIFNYAEIVHLPVLRIQIDFVHGDSIEQLKEHGFPKDKVLAAGIIDGRNVWRAHLQEKFAQLELIKQFVGEDRLIVQPSSSLLHVPVTKAFEEDLDPIIV